MGSSSAVKLVDCQLPKAKVYEDEKYGPWMIAKKTYQRRATGKENTTSKQPGNSEGKETKKPVVSDPTVVNENASGSRFAVLQDQENSGEESDLIPHTSEQI